jgi:fructose-1,6-bisphosphatase
MTYDFNDDMDDSFYNIDTEPRDTISIHQPEQLMEEYRNLLTRYNKLQTYCDKLQKAFSELITCYDRLNGVGLLRGGITNEDDYY